MSGKIESRSSTTDTVLFMASGSGYFAGAGDDLSSPHPSSACKMRVVYVVGESDQNLEVPLNQVPLPRVLDSSC